MRGIPYAQLQPHQRIPAAPVSGRAGMASGGRGDLVICDLTSSSARSLTVLATSPSVRGHLGPMRHRGGAPASPRNHQPGGIWVGVVTPPFHKRVVSACDGSRLRLPFTSVWCLACDGSRRFGSGGFSGVCPIHVLGAPPFGWGPWPTSSYVCELRRAILARGYRGCLRVCPCAGVLRHGLVCDWRVRCGAIRVCASGVVLGTPGARASWGKEGCVRGGRRAGVAVESGTQSFSLLPYHVLLGFHQS